jgi:hypothetical protein
MRISRIAPTARPAGPRRRRATAIVRTGKPSLTVFLAGFAHFSHNISADSASSARLDKPGIASRGIESAGPSVGK